MVKLQYISERRSALGITLQEAAEFLGFKNASTYLKHENGDYKIKAEMLPKLAELLQCEVRNFFED